MIGMLWFDNDPHKGTLTKITEGVAYYREKHGKVPDTVCVHPVELPPGIENPVPGIEIVADRAIRPSHFLIGHRTEASPSVPSLPKAER